METTTQWFGRWRISYDWQPDELGEYVTYIHRVIVHRERLFRLKPARLVGRRYVMTHVETSEVDEVVGIWANSIVREDNGRKWWKR